MLKIIITTGYMVQLIASAYQHRDPFSVTTSISTFIVFFQIPLQIVNLCKRFLCRVNDFVNFWIKYCNILFLWGLQYIHDDLPYPISSNSSLGNYACMPTPAPESVGGRELSRNKWKKLIISNRLEQEVKWGRGFNETREFKEELQDYKTIYLLLQFIMANWRCKHMLP